MIYLKIEEIDGKPVIRLDQESLAKLGAGTGDTLWLHDGGFTTASSETSVQVAIGKRLIEEHIEVFKALAKT